MNKKIINIAISSITFSFVISVIFSTRYIDNVQVYGQTSPTDNYQLSFTSSINKMPSGNGQSIIKTNNNNSLTFSYGGLTNSEGWGSLANGGFVNNQTQINGLKTILINYTSSNSKKLSISYGWDEAMYYQEEITSNQTYSFNNQFPSFFRVDNLTGNTIEIASIILDYSCIASIKPSQDDGFICSIRDNKYLIDVHSLNLPNLYAAYEHAIELEDSQLDNVDEIAINLPNGKLYLENTMIFSGKRNNCTPIRINGNNSKIYGGYQLAKGIWTSYSNGIYRAFIGKNLNKFSNLIVNDEAKQLAKTDQYSFSYSYSNRKITIKKNALDLSSVSGECELVTLETWAQNIGRVSSITSSGTFSTTHTLNLDSNGNNIYFDRTPSYRPTSTTSLTGYLQDNLAFLDEENEWFYDKESGYLFFKPENAFSINTDTFIISTIDTILDTENLVENVIFDGLTFNCSNFSSPLEYGFAETQTSWYYDPADDQNKTITGMIRINSVKTVFSNCTFLNSSNTSIYIDSASVDTIISNNQILNSQAGSIIVGYPAKSYLGEIPENITIENNYINTYGYSYHGSAGICAFYVDKLTINSNEITNGSYSAISVGWGWLYTQTSYGHNRYRILNNRMSNFMNNSLHDGGGIYTLGGFPNSSNELFNEISGNYIEVDYEANGGIYLDEGSSSWDVHENIINVTNSGSTYHGVIMLHDPIDTLNGTYNSQIANHITNNYYSGDMDGSENEMQLTYENDSGTKYSGSTLTNYNNSRNIVFNSPISGSDIFVNNNIYNLSGISSDESYPFKNVNRFAKTISGYTNLSLDSVNNSAVFDVTSAGFIISSDYISDLIKKGYYTLSFNIQATSLNTTKACYAIYITSGSLSWDVFYSQVELSKNLVIPLNKFNVDGATCKIQIRDANGLSKDNNLPARVTIQNLTLSEFPPLRTNTYDDVSLISSHSNEFIYQANNISYNWNRIIFDGMSIAMNKDFPRVRISISGNAHNLYIFKTDGSDIDYNNKIMTGGGAVTIDLEDSDRYIAIMTSHENSNVPGGQDDSGIYGTLENLRISFKFISPGSKDVLFSKKTVNKYFSGMTIHSVSNNTATISFTNSRMKLSHALIEEMINNGVSSIEFDIKVADGCNVESIVTCWFGGPGNTDVTYSDEGTFFKNSNNIIHAIYYANRFNNAYDIELVSRDIKGYQGDDINLENAVISNFVFNY